MGYDLMKCIGHLSSFFSSEVCCKSQMHNLLLQGCIWCPQNLGGTPRDLEKLLSVFYF